MRELGATLSKTAAVRLSEGAYQRIAVLTADLTVLVAVSRVCWIGAQAF